MEQKLTAAAELGGTQPALAATQYEALIMSPDTGEDAIKVKEQAIYALGEVYAKQGEATKLGALSSTLSSMSCGTRTTTRSTSAALSYTFMWRRSKTSCMSK